jgi:hypothetical protein
MRGFLYPNRKAGNPARPDLRGTIDLDGVTYDLSAWRQTAKTSGVAYLSLAVRRSEDPEPAKPDPVLIDGQNAEAFLDAIAAGAVLATDEPAA